MDITNTLLNNITSTAVSKVAPSNADTSTLAKKEKFAKEFEGVFIQKLLGEMKNTIGKWGFEDETGAEQIQYLFFSQLSENLGNQGGLGLWKDIYNSVVDSENMISQENALDKQI